MKTFFKIIALSAASFLIACDNSGNIDYIQHPVWVDSETPSNVLPDNAMAGSGWSLVFSDEFKDERVDFNKWTINNTTSSRTPRPELGIDEFHWRPENVQEVNDNLVLKVKKIGTNIMHCGSVYSSKKYSFKYGYIEARIKVADIKKATHTAFWLQTLSVNNVDGSGNDGAEIDIFESAYIADQGASTIHIDGYGESHAENHIKYEAQGIHDGYHVWGLLWNEETLKVYYDGQLKAEFSGKWVPKVEEYIQLSTGATFSKEGDFKGQPADSQLTEAYVDYVRVWALNK